MASANLYLCTFIVISISQICVGDYRAAVVEYQPAESANPNTTMETNTNQYRSFVEQAKKEGAVIIVFPDYGITGYNPNVTAYALEIPDVGTKPNSTNGLILEKLADLSRSFDMYVVLNLLEKKTNNNNKTLYYSTNLAFNPNGEIVAKSRKTHLFNEANLTPGKPSENNNTFETTFGVTFQLFSTYDLISEKPNTNVKDIVYPSSWISTLPFYHSLSMQHGYAVANKVNLLAANLNNPSVALGGSGIFGSNGTAYQSYISGTTASKILIATVVDTVINASATRHFTNKFFKGGLGSFDFDDDKPEILKYQSNRLFENKKYTIKTLDLSQHNIKEKICHRSFCCQFNINVTTNSSTDVYKLVAYSGSVDIFGTQKKTQRVCSLVACVTSQDSTCGNSTVEPSTKFSSILVESTVANANSFVPLTLTTKLEPIFNTTFDSTAVKNDRKLSLLSELETSSVLAFGIVETTISGSTTVTFSFALMSIIVLRYILF
ncbi:pantetheinase [Diabrotica virgifera virgifera]|uniref:Pantetheinase-like n=1 Tax=Diabrotica virgifera virgifera TaxID=50390 RepID=A0A6P7GQT1_DIAVI|nr:pantetheinase [Diabrotica virgifera virgifera]